MTTNEAARHLEVVKDILDRIEQVDDLSDSERKTLATDARNVRANFDKVIQILRDAKIRMHPTM